VFRVAGEADLVALRDLERSANLAGFAHVFPPDRYPFPDDAVLARWRLVLDDPAVTVLVCDAFDGGGLLAYVAYDEATVRHLAVHPRRWGEGLATAALTRALEAMTRSGAREVRLWVLAENHRARRLYEHLGWRPSGREQDGSWRPYPLEMEYQRRVGDPA
jgi:RimJ/RimL family protein N-acetyltransferase